MVLYETKRNETVVYEMVLSKRYFAKCTLRNVLCEMVL